VEGIIMQKVKTTHNI